MFIAEKGNERKEIRTFLKSNNETEIGTIIKKHSRRPSPGQCNIHMHSLSHQQTPLRGTNFRVSSNKQKWQICLIGALI